MPSERDDNRVGVGGDGGGTERADYLDLLLARLEHECEQALGAVQQIRQSVPGASAFRRRAISQFFERFLRQQSELQRDYAEVMRDYTAAMTVVLARK